MSDYNQQTMLDNPGLVQLKDGIFPERWTGSAWEYHDGNEWREFDYSDD